MLSRKAGYAICWDIIDTASKPSQLIVGKLLRFDVQGGDYAILLR
jgi:hypothetical protein